MEQPILCPYCGDQNIEAVPDACLYAENVPNQTTPIPASVFRWLPLAHLRQWSHTQVFRLLR